ncbi:MAG TPA: FAD-dependent monooxygenase [Pseudonocardiaceae bacterium]|jgi:2-polyprenyl-6-methoxyphenol hydroxylase-like FAD-dependent oxidoreductase
MDNVDVVVVGAGPVGLLLAGELSLHGVAPLVVERLTERSPVPKANGLVGHVVRWLDHRGLYGRLTGDPAPPRPTPRYMFGGLPLVIGEWEANPLHTVLLSQWELERGLAEWVAERGVVVRRGVDVTGVAQDGDGVTVEFTGPDGAGRVRAGFVVGCDGAHSEVRKQAGIEFVGVSSDRVTSYTAHVVLPPGTVGPGGTLTVPGHGVLAPFTYHRTDRGVFAFASTRPGVHLVTANEWDRPAGDEPVTLDDVRAAVTRVLGAEVPMEPPTGPGRFVLRRTDDRNTRQADRYRVGRLLVAGDAAHVHSAAGGPGLNLGLSDAANLGWKLAATVHGWAPSALLDSYHDERHPAGERVVTHSLAQAALLAPGNEVTALRELFAQLLTVPENTHRLAELLAGSDVRHGAGPHPQTGRWVVDFPLTVEGRPIRLAELTRNGRPLLLDFTGAVGDLAAGWADRVDHVVASAERAPADVVLVRPDGYAAWAGSPREIDSLGAALRTWFGAPTG